MHYLADIRRHWILVACVAGLVVLQYPMTESSAQEAAPKVTIATLSNQSITGTLTKIADAQVSVSTPDGEKTVPIDTVVGIKFNESQVDGIEKLARVTLTDGSQISASQVLLNDDVLTVTSPLVGVVKTPKTSITHLRLAALESFKADWEKITQREIKKDLLVIKKGDGLDFAPGVVGGVDEKSVKFLLGTDEIPIGRNRVFGLVFFRDGSRKPSASAKVRLSGDDQLSVSSISFKDKTFSAKLASGSDVKFQLTSVQSIDFSQGKIEYLSKMEPRSVEYTPFFGDETSRQLFQYRRDETMDRLPLKLGGKSYQRGLWIHSKTQLRYRIGTDFSRFEALMGIDENLENVHLGHVHVVISGDGKKLLEADVAGKDKPVAVNLDVTGVRDLEILVNYGRNADICDHLDLVNARVIK